MSAEYPHPLADERTYVYRLFDRQQRLIYVGATARPESRIDVHRKGIWWGPQIHRIKIKVYPNRQQATDAEKEAIRVEHPRWNINLRVWANNDWTRENYQDFLTSMENFHPCKTEARAHRINLAKRFLANYDELQAA